MDVGKARTAVGKAIKARGAKSRRGHLRWGVGDLWWYLDALAEGVGPQAPLRLEVGCWVPALPPEPEGGAVDCPLLAEFPLGEDPVAATEQVLDLVGGIGDLATLGERLGEFPDPLVDAALRELL
ncbi:hypothetical protein KUV85_06735 [Nocardioides panacisoli]|uniref:hypothetical protein n=1 Tax=Nocardioides panacisoli TaxID=627624 RepID=UPI001C6249C8|nr:hypothetical protein [Nocardioides panacisoli]QYJ05369.1 hypothetical protein KUV85_06735 [Nocardioides panacisoli]